MKEIYQIKESLLEETITDEEKEAYDDAWIKNNFKEFDEK
jgi:hypothetical protein